MALGLHPLTLAGLAGLGLGILFHVIGLATPSWSTFDPITLGLFGGCISSICSSFDTVSDAVRACQALALIGLFAALAGAGLTAYHILKPRLGRTQDTRIPLYATVACCIACFFICVCAIVYAEKVNGGVYKLGYSFVLSIIGAILIGASGVDLYVAARRTVGYGSAP